MQNVLHWHIVDTQSFPFEIPSYPKLWNGAYSSSERYTVADAAEIVRHDISFMLLHSSSLVFSCANNIEHLRVADMHEDVESMY